mgnify:CR=1 FL=1
MDIKDYIKEQMEAGENIDDILDSIYSVYNEIAEEYVTQSEKKTEALNFMELQVDFVKKYYPKAYKECYQAVTVEQLAHDFIETFDLYERGYYNSRAFFDDLFDSLI